MLERFLFTGNQQYTPIHKLSGGEKRRLFLLRVLLSAPNVLILDEPTNDLDVQTLTVLEDYLENFNGCVITVSHDRYFLDRTVQEIFALEPGGNIRRYPGSYSVYLETKRKEEAAKATQKATQNKAQKKGTAKPDVKSAVKKVSNKEKREYASLEDKIPKLEAKKAELEKLLYPEPPSDYEALQKLSEEIAEVSAEIDSATERWMELAELIS